jgi:4-hydroxyacetophenone monooxygenase
VVATGFKVTEMAARLDITGRDGKNLRDKWAGDNRPRGRCRA